MGTDGILLVSCWEVEQVTRGSSISDLTTDGVGGMMNCGEGWTWRGKGVAGPSMSTFSSSFPKDIDEEGRSSISSRSALLSTLLRRCRLSMATGGGRGRFH